MKRIKKLLCFLLVMVIILGLHNVTIEAADQETRINRTLSLNGGDGRLIKTLDMNYKGDIYLSVKGLAAVLSGSEKSFFVDVSSEEISIILNADFNESPNTWTEEELSEKVKVNLAKNSIKVNDEDRMYYSVIMRDGEDGLDAYLTPVDLSMILDINIRVENDTISINLNEGGFNLSPELMEENGYMQGVNALLIGDATTGHIFYKYDADDVFAIASTTKLMTYYLFMEGVQDGKVSLNDEVYITKRAEELSNSIDGVIAMSEGMYVPVMELIQGTLLASSNECAYSLAIHLAGSEEAFVDMMNSKAQEMGLKDAIFYNPHGLPVFDGIEFPAKKQNRMTAEDMFKLTTYLLKDFPEIKDITSIKKTNLSVLGKEIKTTNGVLYNIPQVRGLKTGTTNKSGACLISQADVDVDGVNHDLVVVLFGAEGNDERTRISEISVRYGINQVKEGLNTVVEEDTSIPADPEQVVRKLINTAFNE